MAAADPRSGQPRESEVFFADSGIPVIIPKELGCPIG